MLNAKAGPRIRHVAPEGAPYETITLDKLTPSREIPVWACVPPLLSGGRLCRTTCAPAELSAIRMTQDWVFYSRGFNIEEGQGADEVPLLARAKSWSKPRWGVRCIGHKPGPNSCCQAKSINGIFGVPFASHSSRRLHPS